MTNARWVELSSAYADYDQSLKDDTWRAATLAKVLRAQLETYLGGGQGSVLMFDVDLDYEGQPSSYVQQEDPFRAISYNRDYKWFVGYGVTVERAPNAWPKTNLQFTVYFSLADPVIVDTSFGEMDVPDANEWGHACELIYQGLLTAMHNRANKTTGGRTIGFLEFGAPV